MLINLRNALMTGERGPAPSFAAVLRIAAGNLESGITSAPSDATVDWGDGTVDTYTGGTLSHTYDAAGDYVFKMFSETRSEPVFGSVDTRAQIYKITKWPNGMSMPSATTWRNMRGAQSISGSDGITTIDAWTFYDGFKTNYQDCSIGPFPNVATLSNLAFSYCDYLKYARLEGVITACTGNQVFIGSGSALTADADGFKLIVSVGNTCASLMDVQYFPFGAATTTKFQCSDGYIAYHNGAWTIITG